MKPAYGRVLRRGHVAAGLVVLVALAASSLGATVITVVVVDEESPTAQTTELLGFDSDQQLTQRVQVEIGVPFDVPPEVREVKVEREGYWSEEISLGSEPPRSTTLRLVKATDVGFLIDSLPGIDLPTEIGVSFESVPSYRKDAETDGLAGSAICEIRERMAYCRLPSLTLDLRFSAEGYSPYYIWDQPVGEGMPDHAPALELKPGGTILGRVVDERGDPVSAADVYLMPPLTGRHYDPILAARLRRLALESTTNERGYFQLVGIADGSYRVILDKPGLARTEATPEPILVRESEHVLANAVTMPPAAELVLALRPELDPTAAPWQVQAHPRSSIKHLAAESATFLYQAGFYSAEGLVPGIYDLMVKSADGARWWVEPIEVGPGSHNLAITMDLFTVTGTVMAGDLPVAGRLVLSDGGTSLDFDIDEDGEFTGTLPKPGCWGIRVLPEEQEGVDLVQPCERVEPVDGGAILRIELPNTRLAGEVVDGLSQPVEGAKVRVYSKTSGRAFSSALSGPGGEFSLLGVPPGQTLLFAEESGRESEHRQLSLIEDDETPRQVLTLRENGEVTGQVSSAGGGPLTGAQVVLWPELGAASGAQIAVTTTDPSGVFRASLPADAGWLNLIVSAPGFGTRILRESRQQDQPLLVELEPGGGALLLQLAAGQGDDGSHGAGAGRAVVSYEGVTVPLPLLRTVAVEGPPVSVTGSMELGSMAQGTYSLCTGPLRSDGEPASSQVAKCASVFLPRGGRAVLTAGAPDAGL